MHLDNRTKPEYSPPELKNTFRCAVGRLSGIALNQDTTKPDSHSVRQPVSVQHKLVEHRAALPLRFRARFEFVPQIQP